MLKFISKLFKREPKLTDVSKFTTPRMEIQPSEPWPRPKPAPPPNEFIREHEVRFESTPNHPSNRARSGGGRSYESSSVMPMFDALASLSSLSSNDSSSSNDSGSSSDSSSSSWD